MIYLWCHELEGANHGALHLVHPTKFSRKSEVNQPEVQHAIRIITWAIFQNNFNFKLKFLKAYFWWLRSFYLTLRLRGSLELKRTLFGLMSRWQTRALCRYSRASASWRKELVAVSVEFLACLKTFWNVTTILENMKNDLNIDYLCDDNTTLCLREFIVHGRKSGKEISSCSISLILVQTWISNFSKQKIVDVLIMPSANSITITLSETPSKKSTRSIMCLKDMKVQNKSGEFYAFIVCISTPERFHPV